MKKSDSRSVRRFYLSLHFGFVFPAFLQKAMINTRPDVKESPKQVRESVGVYCFAAQPIARGTFTGLSYLYCACFFLLKITKWAQVIRREMWLLFSGKSNILQKLRIRNENRTQFTGTRFECWQQVATSSEEMFFFLICVRLLLLFFFYKKDLLGFCLSIFTFPSSFSPRGEWRGASNVVCRCDW